MDTCTHTYIHICMKTSELLMRGFPSNHARTFFHHKTHTKYIEIHVRISLYIYIHTHTWRHTYIHADVAAKENAQETAVTLCGIVGGIIFASYITDPRKGWLAFILLTFIHVYANYQGNI